MAVRHFSTLTVEEKQEQHRKANREYAARKKAAIHTVKFQWPVETPKEEIQRRLEENIFMLPCDPGCWIWTGATVVLPRSRYEYGVLNIKVKGKWKTERVSRLSYQVYIGPIPEGKGVCHHCDTPLCIRPDHFFAGSQKDNIRDALNKGRHPWSNGPPSRKLTKQDVQRAKTRLSEGIPQRTIALEIGTDQATISRIKHGKVFRQWA